MNLTNWGGRWDLYFRNDEAVSRRLNGETTHTVDNRWKATGPPGGNWIIALSELANPSNLCSAAYWWHRLNLFLQTTSVTNAVKALEQTDSFQLSSPSQALLSDWSFPLIGDLIPLADNGTETVLIEHSAEKLSRKKWFLTSDGKPMWLYSPTAPPMPASRFVIWKLVHEATHLLHLQNHPYAGRLNDPFWRLQMEGLAMASEYHLLTALLSGRELPAINTERADTKRLITTLLWGFFERALRYEADLAINTGASDTKEWIAKQCEYYQLEANFFAFVQEFECMPGFMAGYLHGLSKILAFKDIKPILDGSHQLFNYGKD